MPVFESHYNKVASLLNIHRKTPVFESLFNKVTGFQPFSCEYCEIYKNTIFYRTPPVAASKSITQKSWYV